MCPYVLVENFVYKKYSFILIIVCFLKFLSYIN